MAVDTAPETSHQPYVPDSAQIPEFTWSAVILGALLGIVFGASSLYLLLKVGMTVSASVPIAVLSITLPESSGRLRGSHVVRAEPLAAHRIPRGTDAPGPPTLEGVLLSDRRMDLTLPASSWTALDLDLVAR